MATYFYVEMAECYTPPTKSKAKLPSQISVSPDCASQESPASPHWSLNTDKTAFIMRVPNESIIRLFSLLVNKLSPPVSHISPGRTEFDYVGNEIHQWLSSKSKSRQDQVPGPISWETKAKKPPDMITLRYIVTIWQIRDIEIETFSKYQISSKKY